MKKETKKEIFSWIWTLAVAFVIALFLNHYIIVNANVPTGSMENTIQPGDRLIGFRLSYQKEGPERGDIIIFNYPVDESEIYIKRVIGLPGETVQIDLQGNIYINGQILNEDYGKETINFAGLAVEPITLGDDEYFVMGDNRNNSSDSRDPSVGNIRRSNIIGKAWVRIWPLNKFGVLKHQ